MCSEWMKIIFYVDEQADDLGGEQADDVNPMDMDNPNVDGNSATITVPQ